MGFWAIMLVGALAAPALAAGQAVSVELEDVPFPQGVIGLPSQNAEVVAHRTAVASVTGTAFAMWETESRDRAQLVYLSVRPRGGRWSTPELVEQVSRAAGRDGFTWQFTVDSSGLLTVVSRLGSGPLVSRDRAPDGTWAARVTITPASGDFQIAASTSGLQVVTWLNGAERFVAERQPTGAWGPPTLIERPVRQLGQSVGRIALDGSGNGVIAWRGADQQGLAVWATVRTAGGTWSPATLLGNPRPISLRSNQVAVAMDSEGRALVSWDDGPTSPGGSTMSVTTRLLADGVWGAPASVAAQPYDASSGPVLASFGSSGFAIAWIPQTNGRLSVATLGVDGRWSAARTFGHGSALSVASLGDERGNLYVAYVASTGSVEGIRLIERTPDGRYSGPVQLSSYGRHNGRPAISSMGIGLGVTRDGQLTAAWRSGFAYGNELLGQHQATVRSATVATSPGPVRGLQPLRVRLSHFVDRRTRRIRLECALDQPGQCEGSIFARLPNGRTCSQDSDSSFAHRRFQQPDRRNVRLVDTLPRKSSKYRLARGARLRFVVFAHAPNRASRRVERAILTPGLDIFVHTAECP